MVMKVSDPCGFEGYRVCLTFMPPLRSGRGRDRRGRDADAGQSQWDPCRVQGFRVCLTHKHLCAQAGVAIGVGVTPTLIEVAPTLNEDIKAGVSLGPAAPLKTVTVPRPGPMPPEPPMPPGPP